MRYLINYSFGHKTESFWENKTNKPFIQQCCKKDCPKITQRLIGDNPLINLTQSETSTIRNIKLR